MTAREHAETAARMLDAVAAAEKEAAAMDPEEKLQAAVGGGIRQFNADQQWTVELAVAHALTSLALTFQPREPREPGGGGEPVASRRAVRE